jgi:hypothetical protein
VSLILIDLYIPTLTPRLHGGETVESMIRVKTEFEASICAVKKREFSKDTHIMDFCCALSTAILAVPSNGATHTKSDIPFALLPTMDCNMIIFVL